MTFEMPHNHVLVVSRVTVINGLLRSSQTCLLNMTDMAFPIIFCMESSSDVITGAKQVSYNMFVCNIFLETFILSPYHF